MKTESEELVKIDIMDIMNEEKNKSSNDAGKNSKQQKNKKKKKKSKKRMYIKLGIIAFELIIGIFAATFGFATYKEAKNLKAEAHAMKSSLSVVADYVKAKDAKGAKLAVVQTKQHEDEIKKILDKGKWKLFAKMPISSGYVKPVLELLDIMDDAMASLVDPGLDLMEKHPMDSMKVGDGFNVDVINAYVNFLADSQPKIVEVLDRINAVNLPKKLGFDLDKYKNKLGEIPTLLAESDKYIELLQMFIGDGEDKLYLLAAQNSAEMRASGGFPGSIGTIRIENGILTIGDFKSVYKVLKYGTNPEVKQTDLERKLFNGWLAYPRDAVYCPNFERVAEIWRYGYWDKNGEDIDGVVSLSPVIIQDILAITGSVTLSDGTILDGTNATHMLQYGFYYKYLDKYVDDGSGDIYTDGLFAETAKLVMSKLVDDIRIDKFLNYLEIFDREKDKRNIMMWAKDEKNQKLIREIGCNGGLNVDKDSPEIGVFFSLSDPCKLGWFIDVDTDVVKACANEDGSVTYDVTVTLNNEITKEEADTSIYIVGHNDGAAQGFVHLFAPIGGTVEEFKASNGMNIRTAEYEGLQVGYSTDVLIYPNKPIIITYKVTTAKGVNAPLKVSSTPTLQEYR